jgi:D-3-phosphoglycerate dehydrogenase / 2-oxoglutarate reductase
MKPKPSLLVLNGTCLDVIDEHRAWVESQGIQLLAEQSYRSASAEQILRLLQDADGVILPSAVQGLPQAEQMAACPRLLVCGIAASGFEWLDIDAATRNGIVVCFAPGGMGAVVVAEMTIGIMLAVARQIPFHHQLISRGDHSRGMGTSLMGKTLGIVGLGAIGKEVAVRAQALMMRVVAFDPFPDRKFAAERGIELLPLHELLPQSDFLSLHVRLNDETQNMIGARELKLMKGSAYLINAARRELVDEPALVAAIDVGEIAGAGLDDPPGPAGTALLNRPNVVFTPHLGNRAIEGVNAVFRGALEGAIAVLRGQKPQFVVNPAVFDRGIRSPQCGACGGIGENT